MCWDQKPQSRPDMGRVLQGLASDLLWSLHKFTKPSRESHAALSQFYDSTERKGCVSRLRCAELKVFVNILDDVSVFFNRSHLNPSCDFLSRCYVPRDSTNGYDSKHYTACRRWLAIGLYIRSPTRLVVNFPSQPQIHTLRVDTPNYGGGSSSSGRRVIAQRMRVSK